MTKVCLMCGDTYPDTTTFCAKDGSALRAAVQGDSLIGEVFCDRYVVTDLLGEGGMGAVYAARDVRLPQQVAIKVLREQGMNDPTILARFKQEAAAASSINHDRVARVTDFGFMNDGRAYLIMEYVGGRTLKQVVTDRGVLDVAETSRIVTMVAEGLDAAHRLGIVHRDLKPDNVMILDDAGGGVRVKVLDFGIAKVLHANDETAGQTKTGFVIGTPQWMSPEQILGEQLDGRSDVYSLALLAYMMLTGQRAFTGVSTEAEMLARLSSEPRTLHDLLPAASFPTGLQELLNRTLARNVNDRPSGALAFAKEFANIAMSAGNTVPTNSNTRASGLQTAQFAEATSAPEARTPTHPVATPAVTGAQSEGKPSLTTSLRSDDEQPRTSSSKVVVATLAVAAVAVVAFFGYRQWSGVGNTTSVAPTTTVAGATGNDSLNRATAIAPKVDTPSTAALPPESLRTATSANASATRRAPDITARGSSPTVGSKPIASTAGVDSAKSKTPKVAVQAPRNNADAASAAQSTTAHAELERLMTNADANLGDKNTEVVRDIVHQFELLLPKLAAHADQGNAHFYMAMAEATLGDNAKSCASLNRADPLAAQGSALKINVAQWKNQLGCGK